MNPRIPERRKYTLSPWNSRAALVFLVLIWCLTLWTAFKEEYSFAVFLDNDYLIAPVFSYMARVIGGGEWPLWMPSLVGGLPLYNSPQFSAWYPFYFFFLPIYQNALSAARQIHWVVLLHVLVLEINTYLLLRSLPVSRVSAIVGAALLAFSANTMCYAVWVNIVAPYAWFPLYFCAIVRLFQEGPSARNVALGIMGASLLMLASPAQALIHMVFLTAVYIGWQFLLHWRQGSMVGFLRGVAALALIATGSFLVASPVLIPAVMEMEGMIRWLGPFPPVIGHGKIPFDAFLMDQLTVSDLAGTLLPIIRPRAVGHEYFGLFPLTFSAFALAGGRARGIVAPMVFVALYSLLSSTGTGFGLAYINYHLPLINKIREPSRFLFLFVFSASLLAAVGLDNLRHRVSLVGTPFLGKKELWLIAGLLLLTLTALGAHHDRLISPRSAWIMLGAWALLIGAMGVAHHAHAGLKLRESLFFAVAAAILLFNYLNVSWTPPPIAAGEYLTPENLSLHHTLKRLACIDPNQRYRVMFDGRIDKQRAAMVGSYYGVKSFDAYFNPLPYKQFQHIYYHGFRDDVYFQAMGGKYKVCRDCPPEHVAGYELRESLGDIEIFEADNVAPPYYLRNQLDGIYENLDDYKNQLRGKDLKEGILFIPNQYERDFSHFLNTNSERSSCLLHEEIQSLNKYVFSMYCFENTVFVMNNYLGKAWRASVNGEDIPIHEVNGNQMGILLHAGPSILEIRYAPDTLRTATRLFVAGLVLLIVIVFRGFYRRR